ncbi:ryncolin-1-like [Asterias rubens]|uniref:ryncolin-1-like n=1 Tax=Asterias rubens TaxID=7604 RepID=UPI001455B660|nr:ryncolin-1-like [Asterias rubens]
MEATIIIILALSLMVQIDQSASQQRFIETLYLAENRALLNHGFQWKTVSSPVICGRDCSMDPQCVSFNYHIIRGICVLNDASRAHSPDDFVASEGSAYYDNNLDTSSFSLPSTSSCLELYQAGYRINGLYTIFPTSLTTSGLQVYCDMKTDGGGWIVFQRRQDGSVDFYRNWAEYQSGFGDLQSEFWLGNDIMRDLTGSGQWRLRVDMEDWESNTAWASYDEFSVTGNKYTLQVGSYDAQSTAGDAMTYHNGLPFTTKDQDNDARSGYNCAERYEGAWWFNDCLHSHLNGKYYPSQDVSPSRGIQWYEWKGAHDSLKKCSMKIRQVL